MSSPAPHEMRCFPTPAEEFLAALLAERQSWHFVQQRRLGDYIVDFCDDSLRLVIELDGSSHAGKREADEMRQHAIEAMGYRVVRFTNRQVFDEPFNVLTHIVYARVGL